jgi:hypothetical protein
MAIEDFPSILGASGPSEPRPVGPLRLGKVVPPRNAEINGTSPGLAPQTELSRHHDGGVQILSRPVRCGTYGPAAEERDAYADADNLWRQRSDSEVFGEKGAALQGATQAYCPARCRAHFPHLEREAEVTGLIMDWFKTHAPD